MLFKLTSLVFVAALLAAQARAPQPQAGTTQPPSPQFFLGFDRNAFPGSAALPELRRSFFYAGYWLNNPPGEQQNTWRGRRREVQSAGFGFLLLFNGRQYRQLLGRNPSRLGRGDGLAAAAAAAAEGFPARSIIFLDQEEGGRLLPEQRSYLHAWVDAVSSRNYRAGVYCSGVPSAESSGESVITADDIRRNAGSRDITYWVSNDACPPSLGCVARNAPPPARSGVAFAGIWQFAQSPRRAQFTASCAATYSADGDCFPPGFTTASNIHVDLNTAASRDPSHARSE